MDDCIFCRIAAGRIPARKLHDDDDCVAFEDLSPQAPTHVLIIPRLHRAGLNDVTQADVPLLGHLLTTAGALAQRLGVADSGYRIVINTGPDGGQSVFHLHVHLLGGRSLTWPPG